MDDPSLSEAADAFGTAEIKDIIAASKKEGHTDFDVSRWLLASPVTRPLIDKIRKEGYSDKEIFSHFGLSPQQYEDVGYGPGAAVASGAAALPGLDVGQRVMAGAAAAKAGIEASGPREPMIGVKPSKAPEPLGFLPDAVNRTLGFTGERAPGEERTVLSYPWASGTFPNSSGEQPAFGSKYEQALEQFRGARKEYMEREPVEGNLLETLGATGPGLAVGGLVNRGIQAAGRAVPALAPAADFALGNAGYDATSRALPGAGNFALRLGSNAVQGGVQGAVGAGMNSGMSDTPLADQLGMGALAGNLTGPLVQGGRAIANAARGPALSPQVAGLADTAINRYGLPLRSSTFTNSPVAKGIEKARPGIPFSGYGEQVENEMSTFTRRASNTMGEDAPNLTPDVMNRASDRIGMTMDRVARVTDIRYDQLLDRRLNDVLHSIERSGLSNAEQNSVRRIIQDIRDVAANNNGRIPGEQYQQLTGFKSNLMKIINNQRNGALRQEAIPVRTALDEALQFYAPPGVADELRQARLQWKNMKILEDVVEKLPVDKQFTPESMRGLLHQAIKANSRWAFGQQGGDLGTLAEIGQNFLGKSTAEANYEKRLGMYITGADVAAALATGGGLAYLSDPKYAASSALIAGLPIAVSRYAGRRFVNPALRQRLIDQTLRPQQRLPSAAARLPSLLAGEGLQ